MEMVKTDLKVMQMNPFEKIGSQWMLITAEKDGKVNTMTASWGGVGVLWGKDVATVYIRPQRYTKEFVDAADTFTLTFFDGECKKEMGYLGKVSGRDEADKIEKAGLHVQHVDGYPTFEEASQVLVCKKLYQDDIPMDAMPEDVRERWYADGNYHTMYIAQIVGCYVNEQ